MYEIDPKNSTFFALFVGKHTIIWLLYHFRYFVDFAQIHKETGTRRIGTGACHFVVRGLPVDYFFSAAAFSCRAFSIFSGVMGISVKRQPVAL